MEKVESRGALLLPAGTTAGEIVVIKQFACQEHPRQVDYGSRL